MKTFPSYEMNLPPQFYICLLWKARGPLISWSGHTKSNNSSNSEPRSIDKRIAHLKIIETLLFLFCASQTFVTFYVGLTVAQEVSNDFSHIGGPFLMGTVALGKIC